MEYLQRVRATATCALPQPPAPPAVPVTMTTAAPAPPVLQTAADATQTTLSATLDGVILAIIEPAPEPALVS